MNVQENQWLKELMKIFDINDVTDDKKMDHLGKEG